MLTVILYLWKPSLVDLCPLWWLKSFSLCVLWLTARHAEGHCAWAEINKVLDELRVDPFCILHWFHSNSYFVKRTRLVWVCSRLWQHVVWLFRWCERGNNRWSVTETEMFLRVGKKKKRKNEIHYVSKERNGWATEKWSWQRSAFNVTGPALRLTNSKFT